MKIAFIIPTNNPESYLEYFHNTRQYLYSLRDFVDELYLSFVFQYPWEKKKIKKTIKELECDGFKVRYCIEPVYTIPSMNRLRRIGMKLCSFASYFIIADDNFKFSKGYSTRPELGDSGQRYIECIKYLEKKPSCGVLQCEGALGGSIHGPGIKPVRVGTFWTCYGLFLRNIGVKKIVPKKLDKLLSGLEESVFVYHIIERGYYPAKQFFNPTRQMDKKRSCDGHNSTIHDTLKHKEYNQTYIQQRYNDYEWDWFKGRYPKGLISMYIDNGGNIKHLKGVKNGNKNYKHR